MRPRVGREARVRSPAASQVEGEEKEAAAPCGAAASLPSRLQYAAARSSRQWSCYTRLGPLQSKEVADLEEEAVVEAVQLVVGRARIDADDGATMARAVTGADDGAGRRLVREQTFEAQAVRAESERAIVAAFGVADQDRVVGARVVVPGILVARDVLGDETDEHRPRDLVFDAQPGHLRDRDDAPVVGPHDARLAVAG